MDLVLRTHQKDAYKRLTRHLAAVDDALKAAFGAVKGDVSALLRVETARSEAVARWYKERERAAIRPSETLNSEIYKTCDNILENNDTLERAIDVMQEVREDAAKLLEFVKGSELR